VSRKTAAKKVKVAQVKAAPAKKINVVKVIWPKPKSGPRGMSEIELALAKPIGVSKKFCFPDMPSSSQGRHDESGPVVQAASKLEAHVISFAKLGDSSPDTPEALPLGKTATTDVLPPPMATHGWYSYYSLASLFRDLAVFLVMLPADDGAHLRPSGGMDEDLVQ
jgi:hypothetical protein